MSDVFLNIDEQPKESVSIISERLENRSFKGQFYNFTKEYSDYIKSQLKSLYKTTKYIINQY